MKRERLLVAVGTVIKERRVELGISQEEVACRSGLHRTYIGDVETGARNLSLETFIKIAYALQLLPSEAIAIAERRSIKQKIQSTSTAEDAR